MILLHRSDGVPRFPRTSLLFLLLAALAACLPSAGAAPAGGWTEFRSEEGNFRALFPTPPAYTTSADGKEHRYSAEYQGGMRVLRATYELDYDTTETLRARFANVEALPGIRRTLVAPREVSLGGHRGMEAVYAMVEGGRPMLLHHRIYHAGTTSYQLIAVVEGGKHPDADVERFLASFRLLKP